MVTRLKAYDQGGGGGGPKTGTTATNPPRRPDLPARHQHGLGTACALISSHMWHLAIRFFSIASGIEQSSSEV
jgi:hypothetical protein